MEKLFSSSVNDKGLTAFLVIAVVLTILAAGFYAGSGSVLALTGAAEVVDSRAADGGSRTLFEENILQEQAVSTLIAEGTYTANYVYNDDDQDSPPPDDANDDEDPVDEEPDTEQEPEHSTVKEEIEQGEKATGKVDVPDGATVSIGEEPANGTATVDDDGNWEYTPDDGFSGDDQFTIVIVGDDGTEEIVTVDIAVSETKPEEEEEDEAEEDETEVEDETLPDSGGVVFASIVALWLFVAASFSLKAGVINRQ